ncbi:MAG: hypothetical protein DRI84_09880 [Bacteroidetes bacterium]|nr:MAG: hypothetical protein DRI84_09880 [Bacteroidota bacterium]
MARKKIVTVEWFKSANKLCESYQQTGMAFAFVTSQKDGNKMCHEWVKCRDFLHDGVRTQITGIPCEIYGYKFNTRTNPNIDLYKMRMLITKYESKIVTNVAAFSKKIVSSLALINHFEKQAKVSLTKVHKVDTKGSGKEVVFLFTGPAMWVRSPFLVSMYTFLIRLGDKQIKFKDANSLKKELKELNTKYTKGELLDNDAKYLGCLWDKLHIIIKNRAKLFTKKNKIHDIYSDDISINNFHNRCGIHSLAMGTTPNNELNKHIKEICK